MNNDKLKFELINIIANIMQVPVTAIATDDSLAGYGFDSLSLTSLANAINESLQTQLSPAILLEYDTIDDLVLFLNAKCQTWPDTLINKQVDEMQTNSSQIRAELSQQENKSLPLSINEIIKNELFTPVNKQQENAIAVIGMSCVIPGANNLEEYWALLEAGKCVISDFPLERWSWIQANTATLDLQHHMIKGGFIDDIDMFDAEKFSISPREAKFLDPQQRLLLEQTWKAIEHAGYSPVTLANTKTGVFIGISTTDYQQIIESTANYDSHYTTGTVHSLAANRISYFFDFHGPSEAFNTACSSSLVALNRAVYAIRQGECELAIVGGVNALLHPGLTIAFAKAGMLSEKGLCKTFDESAEGYVRGEGAGIIILKSLAQAIGDKDHIYGVIKGSAVNHGGHVRSLTVPSANAQCDVIVSALKNADISMDTLTYIEAHGTGTKLGDPIEIEGLKRAYMQSKSNNAATANETCAVASVKSNIGHLEAAAGIAGLIKILLMMHYEKIPANVHFNQLNPYIDLTDSPFYIPTQTKDWLKINVANHETPRRAGVSSFGFGGANVHVIIEEFMGNKYLPSQHTQQIAELPFIFSAKTEAKLKECIGNFMPFLAKDNDRLPLVNVAYSLADYAGTSAYRVAFIAATKAELLKKMNHYLSDGKMEPAAWLSVHNSTFNQALDEFKINLTDLIHLAYEKNNLYLMAKAWVHMHAIDWQKFFAKFPSVNRVPLLLTQFNKKRYWVDIQAQPKSSLSLSGEIIHVPENENRIKLTALANGSLTQAHTKTVDTAANLTLKTLDNNKQALTNAAVSSKEINRQLSEILATVLGQELNGLNADQPFTELGLDSILGIEFLKTVNEHFNLALKAEVLYESYTINKLAAQIGKLSGNKETTPAAQAVAKQVLNGFSLDKNKIINSLADTLSTNPEKIMPALDTPFTELGLDSILGVEFIRSVAQFTQLDIRADILYEHYTVNKIYTYLQAKLTQAATQLDASVDQLFESVYTGQLSPDKAMEILN